MRTAQRIAKFIRRLHVLYVGLIYKAMLRRINRLDSARTVAAILEGLVVGAAWIYLTHGVGLSYTARGIAVFAEMMFFLVALRWAVRDEDEVVNSYTSIERLSRFQRSFVWCLFILYFFSSIPLSIYVMSQYR